MHCSRENELVLVLLVFLFCLFFLLSQSANLSVFYFVAVVLFLSFFH